ncbi:MAG: primosomal protein N', partial [Microbacterium sp.]
LMPPAVRVAVVTGTAPEVERAISAVRAAAPRLPAEAVLGPVPVAAPRADALPADAVRALIRFDYASGPAVTESLRAAVVAEALRARRRPKARDRPAAASRNTLRVRVDVPDPEL